MKRQVGLTWGALGLGLAWALATGCGVGDEGPWRPAGRRVPAPGVDGGPAGPPPTRPPARQPARCEERAGEPIVRRLTTTQITNTLEDLLDTPDVPRLRGLTDPVARGYDADARSAVVRDLGADQLMRYAETVAAWAVDHRLGALTSCTDNSAICRVGFIRTVGRRLYRQPIGDALLLRYDSMWSPGASFAEGAEVALRTMLQSPHFLYRLEVGEPVDGDPTSVALNPYELATALAFLTTNSAPDDELLDAAGAGRLTTEEDLDRELTRLLSSPRADEALARFARQWLRVDELSARPKTDPSFTDALRASMLRETGALYVDVLRSGGGVRALFEVEHTFVDAPLAAFYGLEPRPADGLVRVALGGTDRAPGVLGQGSVLATHARADGSSPTQRGALVRRRFLCEELPPPPPDVDTSLTPTPGARTTRERYARHATDPRCADCHDRIDPIGFSLERYDELGRFRREEGGEPVDASGAIVASRDGDVPLDGAGSLAAYLATSPEAHACFAEHLAYYAFGTEGCTYADLTDDLGPDTPLRELLRRLVHTRYFRYRRAPSD